MGSGGSGLLPLTVAIPIVGACTVAASARLPRRVTDVVALAVATAVAVVDVVVLESVRHGTDVTWSGGWAPHHGTTVGVLMVADPYPAGIAALSAVLMAVALLYSWRRFESAGGRYQALMLLFLAGMQGFAWSGDLFDLFVFFEVMGAASYALTAFKIEESGPLQGGLNYAIVTSIGAYLSLAGVGLLYGRTGQLSLAGLGEALAHHRADALVVGAFALVACGLLVKAAIVPFHFWLADAHAVAPTPVCVLLSGVMVELGLYGLARVAVVVFGGAVPLDDVRRLLLVLGAATALVGAVMCWQQRHLKRLLAFSTIAHAGLFAIAVATFTADGVAGAALYVVAHACVKASLFLVAGLLLNRYGSLDERVLFGRARGHPALGLTFLVGGLALAALPPFGTALGKALSEDAVDVLGYHWGPPLFFVVSAVTGAAVLRAGARVFFGAGRRPPDEGGEPAGAEQREVDDPVPARPWSMLVPIGGLLVAALVLGVIPGITSAFTRGAARFLSPASYVGASLFGTTERLGAETAAGWTTAAVVLGLVSAALAVLLAVVALAAKRPERRAAGRVLDAPVAVLRRAHSGHVGDYATWLVVGVVVVALFVGLPLR